MDASSALAPAAHDAGSKTGGEYITAVTAHFPALKSLGYSPDECLSIASRAGGKFAIESVVAHHAALIAKGYSKGEIVKRASQIDGGTEICKLSATPVEAKGDGELEKKTAKPVRQSEQGANDVQAVQGSRLFGPAFPGAYMNEDSNFESGEASLDAWMDSDLFSDALLAENSDSDSDSDSARPIPFLIPFKGAGSQPGDAETAQELHEFLAGEDR